LLTYVAPDVRTPTPDPVAASAAIAAAIAPLLPSTASLDPTTLPPLDPDSHTAAQQPDRCVCDQPRKG
jgi:hypothetical protein